MKRINKPGDKYSNSLRITVNIKDYIQSVKQMTWVFPDYSTCCPLCDGAHCALRIGFYKRKKVVIDYKIYKRVPIARWWCRRKGARKPKHRTFSLLPSPSDVPAYKLQNGENE